MDNIIEKIRRLLALSTSSNVNEAAAAAAMAQKLMTKYQLDELTVRSKKASKSTEDIKLETLRKSAQACTWRSKIAYGLCTANTCVGFTRVERRPKKTWSFEICGNEQNIQVVRYMFEYLCREVDRLYALDVKRTGISGRGNGNAFRLGAAVAIRERLVDTAKLITEDAGGSAIVLVSNEKARVKQTLSVQFGVNLSYPKKTLNIKAPGAFQRGKEAGKSVSLGSGPGLGQGVVGDLGRGPARQFRG